MRQLQPEISRRRKLMRQGGGISKPVVIIALTGLAVLSGMRWHVRHHKPVTLEGAPPPAAAETDSTETAPENAQAGAPGQTLLSTTNAPGETEENSGSKDKVQGTAPDGIPSHADIIPKRADAAPLALSSQDVLTNSVRLLEGSASSNVVFKFESKSGTEIMEILRLYLNRRVAIFTGGTGVITGTVLAPLVEGAASSELCGLVLSFDGRAQAIRAAHVLRGFSSEE